MADNILQARVIEYKIREDKNNLPRIDVLFQTADSKNYTWFGSMHEKIRKNTFKTLQRLGFDPNKTEFKALAKGVASGILDSRTTFQIKIESYKDKLGEDRWSVRGVYLPGEKPESDSMDEAKLDALMKTNTLEDEMKAYFVQSPAAPRLVTPAQKTGTDNEDVPF